MSQKGAYSESKMTWWYSREQKLPDAPKSMQVVLSDTCQQSCHFCAYRMDANNEYARDGRGYTSNELFTVGAKLSKFGVNNPVRQIPTDRAMALLDEFVSAGVLAVEFTGGGEPLLQRDHEKIFSRALDLGLKASLVTNGVSMRSRLIQEILPRFLWVRISIDASNKGTYTKTRSCPPGHWDLVWKNVRLLAESISTTNSKMALGLGFVVTPHSYKEIVPFVRRAKDSGAGNVRLTAMFSPSDEDPFVPIYDEIKELIHEAKEEQTDDFLIYDNFGTRFDDLKQHQPDFPYCPHQDYVGYVGGDLQVYRCCLLAYSKRGLISGGNMKERKFDEFWASQERKDDTSALNPRDCERCQFSNKIRGLLYIMGDKPEHVEFP